MIPVFLAVGVIVCILGPMIYVYRYRGKARFTSLKEYARKGWPIFAPLNCLLYLFTEKVARRAIPDLADFPELNPIRDQWKIIRDEAEELYKRGYFGKTNTRDSKAYYDIGFRTFYKYGWSKFYLAWYGYTHQSSLELCPKTVQILSQVSSVNGAMFSLLPAGSKLTRHLDPVACSLRYHLGLLTPNTDDCYINIDDVAYSWRDGDALLFDETYLHYANNDSQQYRLILMCDVERPLHLVGRVVNTVYKGFMRLSVVPNLENDKQGLLNRTFAGLTPLLDRTKRLKQTNRALYRTLMYSVNSLLVLAALALMTGALYTAYRLAMMAVN